MTSALPPEVRSALEEGRQAYVAVEPDSGPHVTPELYALSGDQLWFATAVSTLKARVLERTGTAAVAVAVPGRVVLLQGPVERYDPRQPASLVAAAKRAPEVVRALAGYTVRNASDLVAFWRDLGRGRLGRRLPPMRALFALDPVDGLVVERGAVSGGWGRWAATSSPEAQPVRPGGTPVVVAAPGPVALPGSWFPDDRELHLEAGLAALLPSSGSFPISLVEDEYSAPGPDAKRGVLLRGTARAGADPCTLAVDVARVVEWDGVDTSSTPGPDG